MIQRDYTKFLREDGRLNVRLLPRSVYVDMVKRHRSDPAVIDKIYNDTFWLWDLNEAVKKAEAEGREVSRSELAGELESGMDDKDWWALTEAFEQHLIQTFQEDPAAWADLVDPVYDMQESEGWRQRQ